MYINRQLEPQLIEYLENFPVVGLTGPRQSGKSTMLEHCLKNRYQYVTFDDFTEINDFQSDPKRFLNKYDNNIIFDEVQKVPEIFDYLKILVDQDRQNYGKFILTGSSQFLLNQKINESLAGRIGLLQLLPFASNEIPQNKRQKSMYLGTYPELVTRNFRAQAAWYSAYLETYIEKDIRTLINISNIIDFRRFITLLAANCSQLVNYSNFAKHLGVSVHTIKSWLSILEASYIIFLLPPYYNNLNKRITKSPKLYFYDTALAAFLTKTNNTELFFDGPISGALFENYIIAEVKKNYLHNNIRSDLYYYRDSNQVEIDLILDHGLKKDFIEIKTSYTYHPRMLKPIEYILGATEKSNQDNNKSYLVYNGTDRKIDNNIYCINYQNFLQQIII